MDGVRCFIPVLGEEEEKEGRGPRSRAEEVLSRFLLKPHKVVKTPLLALPYKTPPFNTREGQKEALRRF